MRTTRRVAPTRSQLGNVQRCVLSSLTHDDATIRTLTYDWPGLVENGVRAATISLGRWGLIEPIRWEGQARVYTLTAKGRAYTDELFTDDEEVAELRVIPAGSHEPADYYCEQCRCRKSGDPDQPNQRDEPCEDRGCACHEEAI